MVRVLYPVGILDSMNGNQLQQAIHDRIAAGDRIFLVDCKEVTFTDSAGLAALVMALRKLQGVSGRLCLCMINQQLEMLLKLTDLNEVFEVFPNQTEFQRALYPEVPVE